MQVLALIAIDYLKEILYFPLWWYSAGLILTLKWAGHKIVGFENVTGFSIWLFNIFTPMYGENDFWGRFISFFIRLFQIIFRGIALLIYVVIIFALVVLWLLAPVGIIILIGLQIF